MSVTILIGDVIEQLHTLSEESVHCCVTSPPYWGLRDYGTAKWEGGNPECDHKREHFGKNPSDKQLSNSGSAEGHSRLVYKDVCGKCGAVRIDNQIGLEKTPEEYVAKIVEVFREVKRVLRDDGTLWLNLGDSYVADSYVREKGSQAFQTGEDSQDEGWLAEGRKTSGKSRKNLSWASDCGLKKKDLCGIPWRVAFALQADGWYLRSDIIWSKPNPMPESVTDRPSKAHEYVFLLTKKAKYFYDNEAVREPHSEANQKDFEARQKRGSLDWGDRTTAKNDSESNSGKAKVGRSREEFHNPAGRNRRTVWEIATQPTPDAHFATFPEALVEPCIKAGTSERGCCPVCGAGWERMVEKGLTAHDGETNSQYQKNTTANRLALLRQAARERGEEYTSEKKTIGWQPTCKCNTDTVPCTVLDPFAGSGTTGLVARNLKRGAILIELNKEYVKIMKKKLRLNEQLVM